MHPALSHWQARDGCLEVGGQSLTRLADRIGQTPFFAYERRLPDERIALLRRCLPAKVQLHSAVHANPTPEVVPHLRPQVDGVCVAFARAHAAGVAYGEEETGGEGKGGGG